MLRSKKAQRANQVVGELREGAKAYKERAERRILVVRVQREGVKEYEERAVRVRHGAFF